MTTIYNNYQLLDEVEENIVTFFFSSSKQDNSSSESSAGSRHFMLTKIEGNAHAWSVFVPLQICNVFNNAHDETIFCTQLFAGKLTNQN